IGHVVGRHSNQQMSKSALIGSLAQGVGMATSNGHDYSSQQMAQYVGNLINLKYGRDDENEADALGVRFLIDCGYDPEQMIGVMQILKKASGGGRQPQMLSSHPDPGNRIEHIRAEIARYKAEKK
ncbi:MAG: peptidase Ste24p, partial [Verrucomicrobiaceae bacterium]|nr:peptidase Ste24p [Verrucomicrobiaceae bacterium]